VLGQLLAASLDAVVVVAADGTITEWNPTAEQMFGWARNEVVGRPTAELMAGRDSEDAWDPAALAAAPAEVIALHRRRDGSVFQGQVRIRPIDGERRPSAWVCLVRDVTERALLDQVAAAVSGLDPVAAIARFAQALREVVPFSLLDLNVVEGDQLRRIVRIGGAVTDPLSQHTLPLAGTSSQMLLDYAVPMVVPLVIDDTRAGQFADEAWLQEAGVETAVVLPLVAEGRLFATLTVGFAEATPPAHWTVELLASIAVGIAQGVQNILAFERQRGEVRRLEELDRLKDDFLSGVSHELRTPLAALKGFMQLALLDWEEIADEEKRELLERSFRNADELSRLVEQLLDFSRLSEGRASLELRSIRLLPLVEELTDRMAPVLSEHHLEIEISADIRVVVDDNAIDRILTNLVSNAAKYSHSGTTIRVEARQAGDEVVVSVADKGIGIPEEHQDRVFERFFQSGKSPGSRRGTGIGLAIVRSYVELLGQRIWVESEPGQGSTFSFTLAEATSWERTQA
jgi:two-component system, NtrC family, sensor histidine kinase KinB